MKNALVDYDGARKQNGSNTWVDAKYIVTSTPVLNLVGRGFADNHFYHLSKPVERCVSSQKAP